MSIKIRKRTWEESFAALQKYKEEHGNCLVPIHSYHEDSALGGWVNHQRSKKCKLTVDQHRRLTDLGFIWSVRMRNKQWNEMLDRLRAYKESHNGDANVPEHWPEDQTLAGFCEQQRKKYRRGQLSSNRQKQLMDMGLQLRGGGQSDTGEGDNHVSADQEEHEKEEEEEEEEEGDDDDCHIQYDTKFDKKYQQLVDFHVMEGHCDIPVESHDLGPWVTSLRQTYKDNPSTGISSECFELLEELGFDWDGPILDKSAKVKAEQKIPAPGGPDSGIEEPDSNVEETSGKKIEAAIAKTNCAMEDKAKHTMGYPELTSAGSSAEKHANQWLGSNDNDEEVNSFTDDEDDQDDDEHHDSGASSESGSRSDDTDTDDDDDDESGVEPAALSRFTNGLFKRRNPSLPIRKGRLTTRMSRSLPTNKSGAAGITSVKRQPLNCPSRDHRFMKQFRNLLEFKRIHGHTRVPQNRKYKTLGGWVNNLRVQNKRDPENGVRPDRVKLLNDAGFVWNATADMPSYDVRWEQQFDKLLDFKNDFSHCRVPQTGPHRRLGRWVATQRALYAKDPDHGIRADRLKRLQDIEFTWDAKGFKGKHFYVKGKQFYTTYVHDEDESKAAADASATESDDDKEGEKHDECDDGNNASVEAVEAEAFTSNIEDGTAVAVAVAVALPNDRKHHSAGAVPPADDATDDATENDHDWNEYYTKLVEFHKAHKHSRVPPGYNAGLAKWVNLQRQQGKKTPIPGRIQLLKELGFGSDAKRDQRQTANDSRWEQLYHQLVAFKEENGHCRVPQNGCNKKLGKWVATQRLLHNKDPENAIRPDRFRLLDELGFTWNAKEFRSRRRFSSPTVAKTPDSAEEGRRKDDDPPCSAHTPKLFSLSKAPAEVSVGEEDAERKPTAFGSTGSAPSSCRMQPLVPRLCDLIDQDTVYPNQMSKGAYSETLKRSLECMIDDSKCRLDCGRAKRKDPPGTSVVKLEP
jgi:Helicase associated domain